MKLLSSASVRRTGYVLFGALLFLALVSYVRSHTASATPSTSRADVLRVAVLGGPEEEVLTLVAAQHPELHLELERFSDADAARRALDSGNVDVGSFESARDVETIGKAAPRRVLHPTVTLPFAFYSRDLRSIDAIPHGTRVLVPTGALEARAVHVLTTAGAIGCSSTDGVCTKLADVVTNPRELQLVPLAPSEVAALTEKGRDALPSAALVGLDFAGAKRLGWSPARHGLLVEDAFTPFCQVLSVPSTSERPDLDALVSAYRSREVKDFLLRRYEDAVRRPW